MSCTRPTFANARNGALALVILLVTACSDSDRSSTVASSDLQLQGSVGDGPVIGAEVTLLDAYGEVIATTTSDAAAKYEFTLPQGTVLPVKVRATGGVDMVTQRALDFELVAVANVDEDATVNLSPQSTLAVATAECLDNDLSKAGLDATWGRIRGQVGMGLTEDTLPDPMTTPIDASNAAEVVLATEALGEAIRRTTAAMSAAGEESVTADAVIAELGCDLAYGNVIDGVGAKGIAQTGAVYRTAEAEVLLEVIAGDLEVDGVSAMSLMDAAVVQIIEPGAQAPSVANVPVAEQMISQALDSLLLLQSVESSDIALLSLADVLIDSDAAQLRGALNSVLAATDEAVFADLGTMLASPDANAGGAAQPTILQQASKAPFISLTASQDEVLQGQATSISWASSAANRCVASGTGDWSGPITLSGRFAVAGLQHSTQFAMRCYGAGGTNKAVLKVFVNNLAGELIEDPQEMVAEVPASPPTTAPTPDPVNEEGDEQQIVDSGTPDPVEQPIAANPPPAQPVAPAPSAPALPVAPAPDLEPEPFVQGGEDIFIAWQAPDEYADGAAIGSLAGYRVYYGSEPGNYSNEVQVDDGQASGVTIKFVEGAHYLAMRAIGSDGSQSPLSNEVVIVSTGS